jgi:hypothetical protein
VRDGMLVRRQLAPIAEKPDTGSGS